MSFSTNKSLLSRLKHGDEIAWEDFMKTYAPLIWLRGGDKNLTYEEKKDLIQEVMLSIFKNSPVFKYDPGKGRFRDFLRKIIDRRAYDIIRKRDKALANSQELTETEVDTSSKLEQNWENEWKEQIKIEALEQLRSSIEPKTYQAFELYAIEKWSASETAKFTGLSINSVYVAKNRAIEKLKEIIEELKGEDI